MFGRVKVLARVALTLALDKVNAHYDQVVFGVERTLTRRMGQWTLRSRFCTRVAILVLGTYLFCVWFCRYRGFFFSEILLKIMIARKFLYAKNNK